MSQNSLKTHFISITSNYFKYLKIEDYLYSSHESYFSYLHLIKRNFHLGETKSIFNDPDTDQQWYFTNSNQSIFHLSHELDKLWEKGITGKNVIVGIVDGGIEVNHSDLYNNHLRSLSYNFIGNNKEIRESNYGRPTRSAGLIAAVSNNNFCGVGAAPNAKFVNLQIFSDEIIMIKDTLSAQALVFKNNLISIYLMNWNINSKYNIKRYPGRMTNLALKKGIKEGRHGLGSIYIFGAGNYQSINNNCAFNGYAQRPEILVFGSISFNGVIPDYTESCTALVAATLSTAKFFDKEQFYSTNSNNKCKKSIGGSAASTAIAAGIVALLLSSNPTLSFRQIFIAIVLTSIQYDSNPIINSLGFRYSYYMGFGLVNANKLIESGNHPIIKYLPKENFCTTNSFTTPWKILRRRYREILLYTSACLDSSFCITRIEQVYITFTMSIAKRKMTRIYLTSARGTRVKIVEPRDFDISENGFQSWKIKILAYFGENPQGVWKLAIQNDALSSLVSKLELSFYGTCINPSENLYGHNIIRRYICSYATKRSNIYRILCANFQHSFNPRLNRDILSFSEYDFRDITNISSFDSIHN